MPNRRHKGKGSSAEDFRCIGLHPPPICVVCDCIQRIRISCRCSHETNYDCCETHRILQSSPVIQRFARHIHRLIGKHIVVTKTHASHQKFIHGLPHVGTCTRTHTWSRSNRARSRPSRCRSRVNTSMACSSVHPCRSAGTSWRSISQRKDSCTGKQSSQVGGTSNSL